MEKAILKTLAYADIFDYPLTVFEIHKWLIGKKATLRQVEKALARLTENSKLKTKNDFYFLSKRKSLVESRKRKGEQSEKYLRKARIIARILKVIPWIKLVGVSGGLAMENASKKDDIDLFIITSKNRLWISRLLALGLLTLTGQRRKAGDLGQKIAGKFCINTLLEEDKLEQANKDIYLAHEVLQIKVLWERDGIYGKYLVDNSWVFKFLSNWTTVLSSPRMRGSNKQSKVVNWIPAFAGMTMERMARWLQLKIMTKRQGMERITAGALYFHPQDCRPKILKEYRERMSEILRR